MEEPFSSLPTNATWSDRADALEALLNADEPLITLFSNAAAFVWDAMDRLNWAGFYFLKQETLYLGPFQGKPACTVIPSGKGVCGAAVTERKAILVSDVDAFPGHVACDAASRSELVVPIILSSGRIIGVLDLDSPVLSRFSTQDRDGLVQLCSVIASKLEAAMTDVDQPVFL